MDYYNEYRQKLRTPEEAVKLVKSGDWVDYGTNVCFPTLLDEALAKRRDELFDVKIRGNLCFGPIRTVESDPEREHFCYNSWHCSSYERKLSDRGLCNYIPMIFRNLVPYYRHFLTVNVAMMAVTPMDRHGFFNLSCAAGIARGILKEADIVILEVNEHLPRILGGFDESIHISEVDHVVEGLAQSDVKDLGMHTELCGDAYYELFKAGKLTNRYKTFRPGKGVTGIVFGSRELYDWVDCNPGVVIEPLEYVNAAETIARQYNMISINNCISVDLYGQVNAESSGLRHISGTGGQLDYLTGAAMAHGGKAFICMTSTFTDEKGTVSSRIVPHFNGEIVTNPRSQSYYIVTEYGAVNLTGRTTWERAELLVSIAHPDFRDGLIREAEKQKIWRRSNKR